MSLLADELTLVDREEILSDQLGLGGKRDHQVWKFALNNDFAVVTTNAKDFIELLDVGLHPGLIVLRESGLSREEQWEFLETVVTYVQHLDDQDFLVNKVVEIRSAGEFIIRNVP